MTFVLPRRPEGAGGAALGAPARVEPVLEVCGLGVTFGALRALDDVDLVVQPGEVVVVAGENGAGKSTLVRCIAGDLTPDRGRITVAGRRLRSSTSASGRAGVAVVWQDLSLCDNLDVAANVLLGRERRFALVSQRRFHAAADELLERLGVPVRDSSRPLSELSGGQRQLVAVARAMRDRPRLLVLDEPTASLGVAETAQVEALTARLRTEGTAVIVVSHDVDQMIRLADRVLVLRHGRVAGTLDGAGAHPDDIVAVINGQAVEGSARRQLRRLHSLADRLAQADASSGLGLILSAVAAALGADGACVHVVDGDRLARVATLGLPSALFSALGELPAGSAGGPPGMAAANAEVVASVLRPGSWEAAGPAWAGGMRGCWAIPVAGSSPGGVGAVLSVFSAAPGAPSADEEDLLSLYAGYVASALERDRLLEERTARNRVLETIREVLESLAGPAPILDGLQAALVSLCAGLGATEVGLFTVDPGADDLSQPLRTDAVVCRGAAGAGSARLAGPALVALARQALLSGAGDRVAGGLAVRFAVPGGAAALVALAGGPDTGLDRRSLLEDAAHSFRLALEREGAERARQEAAALRRSKELHQRFLSRLSHELRTPLTAIHGYASSLRADDVAWDPDTEDRFLERISAESGRLARLVDDLLDSSAIESGTLRLHPDWCDLGLVLDSARAALPLDRASAVVLEPAELPAVWGDHDRLEQVFVNLMDNAVCHNPPGTAVTVTASAAAGRVRVVVADDGAGPGGDTVVADRGPTSGSGLGLSISRGIVEAHGGKLALTHDPAGTRAEVVLPVEGRMASPPRSGDLELPGA